MSSVSEQGDMHRRAVLPCLTERSYSTGMEPGFQTAPLKQVTNSARLQREPHGGPILTMKAFFSSTVWKRP